MIRVTAVSVIKLNYFLDCKRNLIDNEKLQLLQKKLKTDSFTRIDLLSFLVMGWSLEFFSRSI